MCELMWSFKFGPLYSSFNMNSARKYIHKTLKVCILDLTCVGVYLTLPTFNCYLDATTYHLNAVTCEQEILEHQL